MTIDTEAKTSYLDSIYSEIAALASDLDAAQEWLRDNDEALQELTHNLAVVPLWNTKRIYGFSLDPDTSRVEISFSCDTADQLATFARLLARGAGTGGVTKEGEGDLFTVSRLFGCVKVEAYVEREKVCERVVTGTETVVKTALTCQHCGKPIEPDEDALKGWTHVYVNGPNLVSCEDATDDSPYVATCPSLAASVEEVEHVEWICSPILAEAG